MKKLLLLAGAFLTFSAAQAQYYYINYNGSNPRGLNLETVGQNPNSLNGWNTIFAGSAATVNTPTWSAVQTLPFAFSLGGTPVTSYKVSNTGVLTFSTGATVAPPISNVALPSTDIPDNSIMAWGIQATTGDYIITKTFGTAPNRQHWIQFNSFSQTGVSSQGFTYWSIVLEETTNEVHIVDEYSDGAAVTGISITAGIQLNSTTAVQVAASPNLRSQTFATKDPSPADNVYYTFAPGTQPAYDLSVTSIANARYPFLINGPFSISGMIRNLGATPITSFTLNYKVNGGATVSTPVTTNIGPLSTFQFTHAIQWAPIAAGTYTIEAWATDLNGANADMVPANDSGSKAVHVMEYSTQRTVLHEVFTSSTCPPCKPGNQNLHNITTANPGKSIDIKYQQDFPSPGNDPYQSQESINRRGVYKINSIPRMEVDGGWDGNANSYTTNLLNNARNKQAFIAISGTHTIAGHTVTAQATIDPIGNNLPNNDLVAHMVITEKRTIRNVRTNGETEFFDVMKKMMPDENGTTVAPLTAGNPVTLNQAYTFPFPVRVLNKDSVENVNNLEVVIFLQDRVTKEVFQAAKSVLASPLGIAENNLAATLSVYPNPTTGLVNITFTPEKAENAVLEIYNAVGARVWNTAISAQEINGKLINADLSGQPNGFYFLNLKYGEQTVTKKIVLIK
jgi:hypothetical protein